MDIKIDKKVKSVVITFVEEKDDIPDKVVEFAKSFVPSKRNHNPKALVTSFLRSHYHTRRSLVTDRFKTSDIASSLGIPFHSARTVLRRLKDSGAIEVHSSQNGRDGWTQFRLNPSFVENS